MMGHRYTNGYYTCNECGWVSSHPSCLYCGIQKEKSMKPTEHKKYWMIFGCGERFSSYIEAETHARKLVAANCTTCTIFEAVAVVERDAPHVTVTTL